MRTLCQTQSWSTKHSASRVSEVTSVFRASKSPETRRSLGSQPKVRTRNDLLPPLHEDMRRSALKTNSTIVRTSPRSFWPPSASDPGPSDAGHGDCEETVPSKTRLTAPTKQPVVSEFSWPFLWTFVQGPKLDPRSEKELNSWSWIFAFVGPTQNLNCLWIKHRHRWLTHFIHCCKSVAITHCLSSNSGITPSVEMVLLWEIWSPVFCVHVPPGSAVLWWARSSSQCPSLTPDPLVSNYFGRLKLHVLATSTASWTIRLSGHIFIIHCFDCPFSGRQNSLVYWNNTGVQTSVKRSLKSGHVEDFAWQVHSNTRLSEEFGLNLFWSSTLCPHSPSGLMRDFQSSESARKMLVFELNLKANLASKMSEPNSIEESLLLLDCPSPWSLCPVLTPEKSHAWVGDSPTDLVSGCVSLNPQMKWCLTKQ